MTSADKIRNVAIIAHIDHGKTTLIDSIFRAANTFRKYQHVAERVMDSYELERERGITIRAKHCSVFWEDYLINIIDTPGHADFSGEVERVLSMVNSVLLLVDANEGPMPQTRYVLMRALRLGLRPIVVINKVDRSTADPQSALHDTFDLFIELGATDEQADFPVLYGSGLDGWLVRDWMNDKHEGMDSLFETIVEYVPAPEVEMDAPFRMQVCSLAWSDYIGRIGCGRVLQGRLKKGDSFTRVFTRWREPGRREAGWDVAGTTQERAVHLWVTRGLERAEADEVGAGDIVWIAGPEDITIGDTFAAPEMLDPALPPLEIEEPTVSMFFLVNGGPFSGQEGKAVTLRQIKERLERECRVNVSLRMEDLGRADGVKVSGRGELHLGILIEEMRREGMELCVSRPEVITRRDANDKLLEPMEQLIIDVPGEYQGTVIDKISRRKGMMKHMENAGTGMVRLEFEIPTRGLIGYRGEFLTDTRGLGIMSSRFYGYGPWRGEIPSRNRGSLVSLETGAASGHQIESLQERAMMFIDPLEQIYKGQIVAENSRPEDMPCNPCKKKALTNFRAVGKDHYVGINVPRKMSLDQALEWIGDDELVEVTPKSIRLRKSDLSLDMRKQPGREARAARGARASALAAAE
ncbi:MAG: translational GTPase TypA [Candidatus Sumerlaeota bacterium]|nr:translational GTPase TypA [Candidatus Sumerlaeota bacterium]